MNHCIGNNGRIPWHLPDEFAHFEKTTKGKPIIMGRKTYEDHKSFLAGRRNIVISNQKNYEAAQGVEVAHSLDDAFKLSKQSSNEVFVIGGVHFFTAALPLAEAVYETIVDAEIEGDTVLPEFDYSHWNTELLQYRPADKDHQFTFSIYRHCR